jgi:hypothetical protein
MESQSCRHCPYLDYVANPDLNRPAICFEVSLLNQLSAAIPIKQPSRRSKRIVP